MYRVFLLTTLASTALACAQPSVKIDNGTVRGLDLPQFGQSLFLGIPYAEPPVGELRLRPPRSLNTAYADLDATAYGPHCWSLFTTGFDDNSGFNSSEDCLTLNIIRPNGVSDYNPAPVLVWIHGGGFADFRYNGTYLVQASIANGKPIVFVSINYRTGSLGFMGSKELADEGSLNLGLRDQRLALHWVQENIAKFGGDPSKVTVHGQRSAFKFPAGGISIHAQITAYSGRDDGLFNQAIVESGTIAQNYSLPDDPSYQATFNGLIANTNCSTVTSAYDLGQAQLSCIRSLPIDQFRQASVGLIGLFFDGDFLDAPGMLAGYKAGNWTKVAFLVGSNTDEGVMFAPSGANTDSDVKAFISAQVPPNSIDDILDLYPDDPDLGCPFNTGEFQLKLLQNGVVATPGAQNKRVASIIGDTFMAAGPRWLAQEVSSEVPFYKYRFNHRPYDVTFSFQDFVGHFFEVAYVFNTQNNDTDFWAINHFSATYLGPGAPLADRFLGVYMSRAWASFAATGDPNYANVSSQIYWPKYSEGAKNMLWNTQGPMLEKDTYREKEMSFIMDNIFF
ncbi:alpha/beta-hydrolase [Mycena vulgaris]|nr:alpha/beta-hydrolase [Mycena vulgaris]